jgi:RNA polymerase-binding transcription factor DksA
MAVGWARDGAVQEQIDAGVKDAVELARRDLPRGESKTHCVECGNRIPKARQTPCPGFVSALAVSLNLKPDRQE